jgi:CheY-like chemotaxis protein
MDDSVGNEGCNRDLRARCHFAVERSSSATVAHLVRPNDELGRREVSTEKAKPVVLVVEDEPIIRMYASILVEDAGWEPIEASTADEALAILESRDDVRVLFTDVEMPGSLDGLELVEVVRKRWPPVELIVASGHVKVDPQRLPERARFFMKPYDEETLAATLRTLIPPAPGS